MPRKGPAIVIANHNSHLDAVVLMSLFPLKSLGKIHPIAAADYFLANRFLKWFSTKIIGIIPFKRKVCRENPFEEVEKALKREEIIIFFPEGTRGEAEKLSSLKNGIAHLAKKFPEVPIIPIFLHGLGKALPKGDPILVPFLIDIVIGNALPPCKDRPAFMQCVRNTFQSLSEEIPHFSEMPEIKNHPKTGKEPDLHRDAGKS
ncbi:MAG: lysophospholipid acyltransferase family protein [Simkaniaceae bacterium]